MRRKKKKERVRKKIPATLIQYEVGNRRGRGVGGGGGGGGGSVIHTQSSPSSKPVSVLFYL